MGTLDKNGGVVGVELPIHRRIKVEADRLTPLVRLFAELFYRQARWHDLARILA